MSYNTPQEHSIIKPLLVDKKCKEIQTAMNELSWMQYAFARAYKQVDEREGARVVMPVVYQADKDYLSCMPNDALDGQTEAFSFVYVKQPQSIELYDKYYATQTCDISIIVFVNLLQIDSTIDYRFTERLKLQVLNKLSKVGQLTVTSTYDDMEECYSDFTQTAIEAKYLDSRQFAALRFDAEIKYGNNCKI